MKNRDEPREPLKRYQEDGRYCLKTSIWAFTIIMLSLHGLAAVIVSNHNEDLGSYLELKHKIQALEMKIKHLELDKIDEQIGE